MTTERITRTLDVEFARSFFPALEEDFVFFDNAGGSQTLKPVVDRISDYLLHTDVQHGASYPTSQVAMARLREATETMASMLNAPDVSELVMGPSTTQLIRILAHCLASQWKTGDELIICGADHEANISPWTELASNGISIKRWDIDWNTYELDLNRLESLMTDRTRLVAFTHCSNILGNIHSAREIVDLVHQNGALACIDGVAYAPHRLVDVQALDADFYAYSYYKVYGPHHAVMYGKADLLRPLPGFNHYFVTRDELPYKFQPGNVNYELSYGMLGLADYLTQIAQHHVPEIEARTPREHFQLAFDLFAEHEEQLANRLLKYLNSRADVRILGSSKSDKEVRVPTVSFVIDGRDSEAVVRSVDPHRIGIRFGDFYAKKLIEGLGLVDQNGVIRVSMVHYNTAQEVERLIEVLENLQP